MDNRIIALYDDFVHGHFDRRRFLAEVARMLGGTTAALTALTLLRSNYALAAIVAENDPRIGTQRVQFQGATGTVKAYLAEPKADAKHPGVVVIHQNRGLNPHIEDIARRLATDGYAALAVDFLSPQGGTPTDEDDAMKMFRAVNADGAVGDARAAATWLRGRPEVNGKIGMVGFCWGGDIVNRVAVTEPGLDAAVVFYGLPPPSAEVARITAPLLLNYADPKLDTRIGARLPDFEEALKAAHVSYQMYVYEGANHGFNDDTAGPRYDATAAKLAWGRTLDFFKQTLS